MPTESLEHAYETFQQKKDTLPYDFEQIKQIFLEAIKAYHLPLIDSVLQYYAQQIIKGQSNEHIFYLLKDLESYFTKYALTLCPLYYQVLGDALYYCQEQDMANDYYRLAISHSTEQKDYITLAKAMTHFTLNKQNTMKEHTQQTVLKSIPLVLQTGCQKSNHQLITSLLFYMEWAIVHGKQYEINHLVTKLFMHRIFNDDERLQLLKKRFTSALLQFNHQPKEALAILNEVFKQCLHQNSYPDILLQVYETLTNLGATITEEQQQQLDTLLQKLKQERQQMLTYLDDSYPVKSLNSTQIFGISRDEFTIFTNECLEDVGSDTTLLLIDVEPALAETEQFLTLLTILHNEMLNEFRASILATTVLNNLAIAYLLPLSKIEVYTQLHKVIQKIQITYPENVSIWQAIHYAAVNNKEHSLTTADDYFQLAYAYLYYELH